MVQRRYVYHRYLPLPIVAATRAAAATAIETKNPILLLRQQTSGWISGFHLNGSSWTSQIPILARGTAVLREVRVIFWYSPQHQDTNHSCFLSQFVELFQLILTHAFSGLFFLSRYAMQPRNGRTFFVCGDWANKAASHAWAGGRVVEFQCIFSRLNFSIFHSILLQRDDCYQRKPKHFVYLCSFLSKRWRRRKK